MKICNIGIVAHVDAGKTTITEQMLFRSGTIAAPGSVDKGTSNSDNMTIERERGISVRFSTLSLSWKGMKINMLDTPGHSDFVSEVERSFLALDAAILVISAADGIQSHTAFLWQRLQQMAVPTFIVVNKVDHPAFHQETLLEEIIKELRTTVFPLQEVVSPGEREVEIVSGWNEDFVAGREDLVELLANHNDEILSLFLEGEKVPFDKAEAALRQQFIDLKITPILFTLARDGKGITALLDAILSYAPIAQKIIKSDTLSGVVFKVEHVKNSGKRCWVRLFSGTIENRTTIAVDGAAELQKVMGLQLLEKTKLKDAVAVGGGEIAVVAGLDNATIGSYLGEKQALATTQKSEPILTVCVESEKESEIPKLLDALQQLNYEDPTLSLLWLPEEREFHLKIFGWMQIDILKHLLQERFGLATTFSSPSIIYKETPSGSGFGYDAYTMPKPCWAEMKLLIEPGERGSGYQYHSEVSTDRIAHRYQKEIERSLPTALKQGVLGWEITDIKLTLVAGEDHVVHSRAGNFNICTNMALMNGLKEIGSSLLEPINSFEINAPEEMLGKIVSDLTTLRASFEHPEMAYGKIKIVGKIPVATSLDYPVKLTSRSGGKAKIYTQFIGYQRVDNKLGKVKEYRGISPLDRAKYILKMRNAIQ